MVKRRVFLNPWLTSVLAVAFVGAFLLAGALSKPVQASEFSDGAKKFIEAMTQDAITMLTGELTREERAERFRTLMNKNFSIPGIAKFVVGRHLRKASDDEKTKYMQLYEDLMVATYAERFAKYSGEKLLVKKADVRGKKDVIVYTTMVKADNAAKPLKVDWRVREKGNGYTIIDVMVEGISMIMTQKSEFSSYIKSSGGEFKNLLGELEKRVKENKSKTDETASK
ncbi:MAG: ABC transporter substrate-binding protein [Alphaproteobacteria bacterium]|nr:ABC transporter substrate-binding protein [Alphaproteobacteria bacterium]MBT7943141.1 ABC transporter substrate-binding protein [Alphaproteobacteria bacterium]